MAVLDPSNWKPEIGRDYLDDMTATQIWNELLLDAKMNHATEVDRFMFAIVILSKKWRKHADAIMVELEGAAKELNGYGLPRQPAPGLHF